MVVTCFAACGDKTPDNTDPQGNQGGIPDAGHTHAYVDGKCSCGATDPNYNADHQHTFVDGVCSCGATDPDAGEIVFEDVDETVYVDVATLTLRATTEFGLETNIKGYVEGGTALKRTGYHKDWSRVEFEGEIVYCATNCLTTVNPNPDHGIVFTDVNETVKVDTTANKAEDGSFPDARYYLVPVQGVDEYVAGFLAHDTVLKRTGVYYEPVAEGATDEGLGWSRIEIDGTAYYIRNSVVTVVENTTPDNPTTPAGYVEYNNGAISFAHPEGWTLNDGATPMIVDMNSGNNVLITYSAKDDTWSQMTADIYLAAMNDLMAAQGITLSNVAVEHVTTANGEKVVKITQTTATQANPTGVPQTLFIIRSGANDYVITVTEQVALEGLVDTVFATLKSVQ